MATGLQRYSHGILHTPGKPQRDTRSADKLLAATPFDGSVALRRFCDQNSALSRAHWEIGARPAIQVIILEYADSRELVVHCSGLVQKAWARTYLNVALGNLAVRLFGSQLEGNPSLVAYLGKEFSAAETKQYLSGEKDPDQLYESLRAVVVKESARFKTIPLADCLDLIPTADFVETCKTLLRQETKELDHILTRAFKSGGGKQVVKTYCTKLRAVLEHVDTTYGASSTAKVIWIEYQAAIRLAYETVRGLPPLQKVTDLRFPELEVYLPEEEPEPAAAAPAASPAMPAAEPPSRMPPAPVAPAVAAPVPVAAPPPQRFTLSLIPRHFWAHKEDIFCVPALGYAMFSAVQLLAGPFALGVALGALISGLYLAFAIRFKSLTS